jgi:chromosomal replication initiator protein
MDLAKEVVGSLVSGESSITTEKILKLVCEYYKVDFEMLRSRSRKKVYAYPRNIYAYLCRKHSDETLESIGRSINRSHSTVVYATELVEKKMKTDRSLKHQVGLLSPNAWMTICSNFKDSDVRILHIGKFYPPYAGGMEIF